MHCRTAEPWIAVRPLTAIGRHTIVASRVPCCRGYRLTFFSSQATARVKKGEGVGDLLPASQNFILALKCVQAQAYGGEEMLDDHAKSPADAPAVQFGIFDWIDRNQLSLPDLYEQRLQ